MTMASSLLAGNANQIDSCIYLCSLILKPAMLRQLNTHLSKTLVWF